MVNDCIVMSMEMPFHAMVDSILDLAWCDTPCVRIMGRDERTGRWTCTDMLAADEARDTMQTLFRNAAENCDCLVVYVELDDVRVSGFLTEDDVGTLEVFGAPDACVAYMEKVVEE